MSQSLETERLILRPWGPDDVALLSRLASNPRMTRYVGLGQTWSAMKTMTVSDQVLAHWRAHGFGWRVALEPRTGAEIGLLALNRLGDGTPGLDPGEYEIGWWIDPRYWSHGYGTEAARAVAEDAFASLGAAQLVARIKPENTASVRVATAIGMSFAFNTVTEPGVLIAVYQAIPPLSGN